MTKVRPKCKFCDQEAVALAPQSGNLGVTVEWCLVCSMHADGWWEGSDWVGQIFPIGEGE